MASARAEFARQGYAATRMDDIAAGAGISKAALYLHFGDKQALFRAMVEELIALSLPELAPGDLGSVPAEQRLRRLIHAGLKRLTSGDIAFLPRLIVGESGAFPELAKFYHDAAVCRILALIGGIISDGIARGEFRAVDPALSSRSVAGAVILAALWKTVFEPIGAGPIDVESLADSHADLLLHGLLAQPQELVP